MFFWDKHKTITCYYESLTKAVCDKFDLTQMEYDILMFLYNNPQYNTAADIVKVRKSTKSHVSTSLKMLEDKGFIKKRISEENKKRIEITLMDNAQEMITDGLNVSVFAAEQLCNLHGCAEFTERVIGQDFEVLNVLNTLVHVFVQ